MSFLLRSPIQLATIIAIVALLSILSILPARAIDKHGIERVKTFPYTVDTDGETTSYGSRIFKTNCMQCHGQVGLGNVNRKEFPRILGITPQQMVDSLVYYRDAESYGIELTGRSLLMSRQVLALSNDQILSIARYFEELSPNTTETP